MKSALPIAQTAVGNKLASIAAQAPPAGPGSVIEFKPRSIHKQLAGALLSPQPPATLDELAAAAGITPKELFHVLDRPGAVAWIISHTAEMIQGGLGAVYSHMLHMAVTSKNPKWAQLYLQRFDAEYQKSQPSTIINGDVNTQQNFSSWNTAELTAFLRAKRQKVLGENNAIAAS